MQSEFGDAVGELILSCSVTYPVRTLPLILGSLSKDVFERRTSTGSGLFSFLNGGFAQIFSQITSLTVKKLRNTNFISSRHVKRENALLPVDVRRSKTPLLKLSITTWQYLLLHLLVPPGRFCKISMDSTVLPCCASTPWHVHQGTTNCNQVILTFPKYNPYREKSSIA